LHVTRASLREFDWHRIPELIDAYESTAHSPISDSERAALGPYLATVPLYLAATAGYLEDPALRTTPTAIRRLGRHGRVETILTRSEFCTNSFPHLVISAALRSSCT
jgi:hypothetical protein